MKTKHTRTAMVLFICTLLLVLGAFLFGDRAPGRAQERKQAVNTQIKFVCSDGQIASYDEFATVKASIGNRPLQSPLTYDVPAGSQTLSVTTHPPAGNWIITEIKFLDMSNLSRPGWRTFTPRAPQANVSLNLSPRYGTTVSQLEITVDQCGAIAPASSMVRIRPATADYPWCKRLTSFISVSRIPGDVLPDRVLGIENKDGRITDTHGLNVEVDMPGKTLVIVPGSNSKLDEGWQAAIRIPGAYTLTLEEDSFMEVPCYESTFKERIVAELKHGVLNFLSITGKQYSETFLTTQTEVIVGIKDQPGERSSLPSRPPTEFALLHHGGRNQASDRTRFTIDLRTAGWTKIRVDEGGVRVTPRNTALRPFILRAGQQAEVSATSVTGVTGNKDGAGASTVTIETSTNRPGEDYRNFELSEPRPELCQAECAGDPKCKAFTYVRPGLQGPRARCWLKSTVPPAAPNPCCVSGVKRDASGGMPNPRYIGCYKDTSAFDLDGFLERSQTNTPQRCIQTCAAKGFAYAGVQYGQSCLCGNSYGKYGPADNCNYKCTGDPRQICGGYSANSVFATR
jgi:hypothetical protein